MLDSDLVDEYLSEYRLQTPAEPISQYEGNFIWFFIFCISFDRVQRTTYEGNESIILKRSTFKLKRFWCQSLFQLNESELMNISFDHGTIFLYITTGIHL